MQILKNNSFADLKIRCSSIGSMMTDPRSKSEMISATCKTVLIQSIIESYYGREMDIHSKYMEKGTLVEEDAITLYSRINKTYFKKNKDRLTNKFLSGEPDLYTGESIFNADKIVDTKSAWNLFTFLKAKYEGYSKDYYWQLQGYMALTNAKSSELVYCLINTPEHLIEAEKQHLYFKIGNIDGQTNDAYVEGCKAIDRNSIFDDIPLADRMFTVKIDRDDTAIAAIYERVELCRKWISETFFPSDTLTDTLQKSLEIQNKIAI